MNENYIELLEFLKNDLIGDHYEEEDLSDHCWYRIGGPADFLVYPKDKHDLLNLFLRCRELDISCFVLGEGANLLISDSGYKGVVVKLNRFLNRIELKDNEVTAEAGCILDKVILFCEKNNLGGLAYLAGIPGTIGGALAMNTGIDKGEIGDVVEEVSFLNKELEFERFTADQIDFSYRSVPQLQDKIIYKCRMILDPCGTDELVNIRKEQLRLRRDKQPLEYPSCGSVFKRPSGDFAGRLIEKAGLKGMQHGGARISEKHAGFIINLGNAKAEDVKYLIDKVREEVYNKFNVLLEPEVRFLGFSKESLNEKGY